MEIQRCKEDSGRLLQEERGDFMKAKTKFKKMYYKLPKKARHELFYTHWTVKQDNPLSMSLFALWNEIQQDTPLGKMVLDNLGFKDD
jgi:hypothetical protein